jgi:hypothetical protein
VLDDFNNDALRQLTPELPYVAPTSEVNDQLVKQLARLSETEKRLKAKGAAADILENIRQQKLSIRRALSESGDETKPTKNKPKPTTPVLDADVFTGTVKYSEVAEKLTENLPGYVVKPSQRVNRTLDQVEALMRTIPDPRTGKPLLKPGGRFFKTWSKESNTSPFAYLKRIGIDDPKIYRMFEREGAFIDKAALSSPEFRVVTNEAVPTKTSQQLVVNTPKFDTEPKLIKAADDVSSLSITGIQSERNRIVKAINSASDPTELIERLTQIEEVLADTKTLVSKPENLKIIQEEVIPETMHGTSPEVVELTVSKIDLSEELGDVGAHIQELEIQVEAIKEMMDKYINGTIEETADIVPVDVVNKRVPFPKAPPLPSPVDNFRNFVVSFVNSFFPEVPQGFYDEVVKPKIETPDVPIVKKEATPSVEVPTTPSVEVPTTPESLTQAVNEIRRVENETVKAIKDSATKSTTPKELTTKVNDVRKEANKKVDELKKLVDETKPTNVPEQQLFHGTRVVEWDVNSTGAGEWGGGTYYSASPADAVDFAKRPVREAISDADINTGQPVVHEVSASFVKVIDVNETPNGEFLASLFLATNELLSPSEFNSFKKIITYVKEPTKLKAYIKNVNDVYAALERFGVKNNKTPEQIHEIKTAISRKLHTEYSYGAISNGSTYMSIGEGDVFSVMTHSVGEVSPVDAATSAYNAASKLAADNPEIPTVNAAQAEAGITLQRQMYEDTLIKLEEVKRQQRELIVKSHDLDKELTQKAGAEQADNLSNEITEGQARAERQADQLNKPNDNPCEF